MDQVPLAPPSDWQFPTSAPPGFSGQTPVVVALISPAYAQAIQEEIDQAQRYAAQIAAAAVVETPVEMPTPTEAPPSSPPALPPSTTPYEPEPVMESPPGIGEQLPTPATPSYEGPADPGYDVTNPPYETPPAEPIDLPPVVGPILEGVGGVLVRLGGAIAGILYPSPIGEEWPPGTSPPVFTPPPSADQGPTEIAAPAPPQAAPDEPPLVRSPGTDNPANTPADRLPGRQPITSTPTWPIARPAPVPSSPPFPRSSTLPRAPAPTPIAPPVPRIAPAPFPQIPIPPLPPIPAGLTPPQAPGLESTPPPQDRCETPEQRRDRQKKQRENCREFITIKVRPHKRHLCVSQFVEREKRLAIRKAKSAARRELRKLGLLPTRHRVRYPEFKFRDPVTGKEDAISIKHGLGLPSLKYYTWNLPRLP